MRQRGEGREKEEGRGKREEGRSEDGNHSLKPSKPPKPSKPAKLSYNEKRELEALPAQIEALEKEIADIQAADPVKDYARYADLPAREAELERLVDRWAVLAERA